METVACISGSGVETPTESISNDELVASFNQYVDNYNHQYAKLIIAGEKEALAHSDSQFIEQASGIRSRYVVDKGGILDVKIMHPIIEHRGDSSLSFQAEMAMQAAKNAMLDANKNASEIDGVIVAASNMQRAYPAISIEVQQALAINGFAFDMNVACSSATFALSQACALISSGSAKCILVINPEICTAHLNFRDRDSHFIFGDVATACIIERADTAKGACCFSIKGSHLQTQFSNNIRNNFGFLNRITEDNGLLQDKLFYQNGRKVFKEVIQLVLSVTTDFLEKTSLTVQDFKQLWLHQANKNMNRLIAAKLLGNEANEQLAPTILGEYANTASAGSILAFHFNKRLLEKNEKGLLCSFGAGYSIGMLALEKM